MKRIQYNKVFLTGVLKGLSAPCGFTAAEDTAGFHVAELKGCTATKPGRDAATGNMFYVADLTCEAIPSEIDEFELCR